MSKIPHVNKYGGKMLIVITPCTAKKDDSTPISNGSRVVQPSYYLDDKVLVSRLYNIREQIFRDSKAKVGTKLTYAFDLYIKTGRAYRHLRDSGNQKRLKSTLISGNKIEWFFLSGGYGIIHALEATKKYQATFNRNIAYQKGIPYTANLWKDTLTSISDAIFSKLQPEWLYVFGSKDYTYFVKQTNFWRMNNNIKMFESTGSSGPSWLSPRLNELVYSVFNNRLGKFNEKYEKYVKQESR
jgi:cytoplasmic iron level regulating protein YaaA (DUF328/UPF0246 family)